IFEIDQEGEIKDHEKRRKNNLDKVESYEYIEDQKNDDAKAEHLVSFIGSLDKKRKRIDNDSPIEKHKKQIKERTEAYEESEYNLTTRESSTGKKK
ncbi:96_t:CDS:2, partial [Scutellospora calospora]